MSWGGGSFNPEEMNEIVPGAYLNISVTSEPEFQLTDRGYVAVPMELPWGKDGEVITVTAEDYRDHCNDIFGYPLGSKEIAYIDEMFKNASVLYIYRTNGGETAKADIGQAQCSGELGNKITVVVEEDPEAGILQHDLKNTKATFQGEGDTITINYSNVPDGYSIRAGLYKGDSLLTGQYNNTVDVDEIKVKLVRTLATGEYTVKAQAVKNGMIFNVSSAKVTATHTDSSVSKVKVTKGQETPNGDLGEDENFQGISVTYTETENSVTATYAGLDEKSCTISCKLTKDGTAKDQDSFVERTENATSVTYTFDKGIEVGDYKVEASATHESDTKEISNCTYTIAMEGEDKEEAVTVITSETTNEEYEDVPAGYIVRTFFDGKEDDTQKVADASALIDNKYVKFNKEVQLTADAGIPFTGGTDDKATGEIHEQARSAFESYAFNILALPSTDKIIQDSYIEYTKRLRDEYGVKFQTVMPAIERTTPINYEGIIQVGNEIKDEGYDPKTSLVYWVAGAEAGCAINESCMNKAYDGNFTIKNEVTRAEQVQAIKNGVMLFHKVGDNSVILKDCNSFVNVGYEEAGKKNASFGQNQSIRVLDSIALETATLFNTYFLGKQQNDEIGRIDLKNRLIKIRNVMAQKRAIQTYDESVMEVRMGNNIEDVVANDAIQFNNAMEKLYYTLSLI